MSQAAPVANALPSGYVLNEYRIESVLGAGNFGLTYLATDGNLNLKVALKEYLPGDYAFRNEDSTVQPKAGEATETFQWGLQRFMDEAKTLASFRHPNIVRVMRFFEANKTGYMVMEFVEGKPLSGWITTRRPLSKQALLETVMPLLDGLEVIHKAGYLHRDVKPANVFMREDGGPVLLDFGSARQLAGGSQELTALVSPGYAPFEQYHTQGKQGPWSDLYALGGVMYWMATGNKPLESAARVREDHLPPASQVVGAQLYGAELLAAIDWALKSHENDRPQSVGDFRRALLSGQTAVAADAPTVRIDASSAPTLIVEQQPTTGMIGVAFSPELLGRIEADLTKDIGPIASAVVKLAAAKARDEAQLRLLVADEIKGLAQRAREEADAKSESVRKARIEAEDAARARAAAEATAEAELKARAETERKAREEAEAKAEAERKAQVEVEARAGAGTRELQEKARRAHEVVKVAEEAERNARREAEEATRARVEAEAIAGAQRKAREEAERKALKAGEEAAQAQAKVDALPEAKELDKRGK